VRIPLAARSLVNRDCILVWLSSEWDETLQRPNKAAEEERTSILRIFADVIETLCSLEMQRRERDAVAEEGNGDATVARPTWLTDVAVFIKKAAVQAGMSHHVASFTSSRAKYPDAERLETLSKMLLQTSAIELNTEAFLALVTRLDTFKKSSQTTKTVENLFQASLTLAPTTFDLEHRLEALQGAVDGLRRRVTRLDGPIGDWSRKAVRQVIFETRETA
jgi:hypothetical protein